MATESPPPNPRETLDLILHHLLPLLLTAALSVKSLVGRWRLLHSDLSLLRCSLSDAAPSHHSSDPLFLSLLPSLLSTLRTLHSLSSRCLDSSLPAGKLLLQSDLHIAAAALSLHLHHLRLLLPLPNPSASLSDHSLVLRDLFARLQIGSLDLKQKALDSLLALLSSDPTKIAAAVAVDGDLGALIRLLDPSTANSLIQDQASAVVSILCTASSASCTAVLEEGGLGPLLRLLDTGSAAKLRESAAAAIEAITADPSNAWAVVSTHDGVRVLVDACRSSSAVVSALAAGCLGNISAVDELRSAMVDEGAVPVLVQMLASGGNVDAQKKSADCISALASLGGDEIRVSIVEGMGLHNLLKLVCDSSSDAELIHPAMRAIHALSASASAARALSSSPVLFARLTDLITVPASAATQEAAAALLRRLSPSEEVKRSMAGCMAALVKMMESSKPASAQEAAASALCSLLAVRSNRRGLLSDGESLRKLAEMLDPSRDEVCKKFPVAVVAALAGDGGCRKRMEEAGVCRHLQKLVEADVYGAKKALNKITGGRLRRVLLLGAGWRE